LNMIRNKDFTIEKLKKMSQFVQEKGGIQYAEKRMQEFKLLAAETIKDFPDSPAKKSLLDCLDFAMKRSK